ASGQAPREEPRGGAAGRPAARLLPQEPRRGGGHRPLPGRVPVPQARHQGLHRLVHAPRLPRLRDAHVGAQGARVRQLDHQLPVPPRPRRHPGARRAARGLRDLRLPPEGVSTPLVEEPAGGRVSRPPRTLRTRHRGALAGIRTQTEAILSRLPLPVGLRGPEAIVLGRRAARATPRRGSGLPDTRLRHLSNFIVGEEVRVTRMSATERRAALARAALTVVDRDGVHAATTRAIVAEAQMPLGSFHYAVPSRDELLRDVIELVVADEGDAALAGLLGEAVDPRDAIRRTLTAYLDHVRAQPGREQPMFQLTQYALRSPALDD